MHLQLGWLHFAIQKQRGKVTAEQVSAVPIADIPDLHVATHTNNFPGTDLNSSIEQAGQVAPSGRLGLDTGYYSLTLWRSPACPVSALDTM